MPKHQSVQTCVVCLDECSEAFEICCGEQIWHFKCVEKIVDKKSDFTFTCPLCRRVTKLPKVYCAGKMDTMPITDVYEDDLPTLSVIEKPFYVRVGPWRIKGKEHSVWDVDTVRLSLAMIERADYVIARPTLDSYGTLVEIGYAYGSGKPVIVVPAVSETENGMRADLWFSESIGAKSIERMLSVRERKLDYVTHMPLLPSDARCLVFTPSTTVAFKNGEPMFFITNAHAPVVSKDHESYGAFDVDI